MRTIALPIAAPEYRREEEQVFRDRVRHWIEDSNGKSELPMYSGMQSIIAKGTNATFSAPTGATPTYIPLEAIFYDTDNITLSLSPHKIKAPYTGIALVTAIIDNVSTGSGAVQADVSFLIYKNGTLLDTNTFQLSTTNAWRQNIMGYLSLVKEDEITLYVVHNKASAFTFDLTKSSLAINMISPNPTYQDRTRI